MRKLFTFISILIMSSTASVIAAPGDTITVQTFTFGSPQDAWFTFPSDTVGIEKIYMKYTLKCNPAQNPACGEWDYLTYTYLYHNTHTLDSTLITQPGYSVNGASPDTLIYRTTPGYSYSQILQQSIIHTDTTSLITAAIGTGGSVNNTSIHSSQAVSRSQNLWLASEMTTAGLAVGNITGLRFNVNTAGNSLRFLTIRIKAVTNDSLTVDSVSNIGFVTVFRQDIQFTNGWNSLQFLTPFNWDGTSNLLIDVTYNNLTDGNDQQLSASTTPLPSVTHSPGADRCVSMVNSGYINVPVTNQIAALDNLVTVSFWAYGDPVAQPMNGYLFEAVDSVGDRLLNSHCPWGDSNVYFDAGYSGTSYDRINAVVDSSDFKSHWTYWTMTKNATTGSMKVYINGNLAFSGTGKTKSMHGIRTFHIGASASGNSSYKGRIDEFAVFNAELSQATIQQYMYKDIDASHPNYSNLACYYHFNDNNIMTAVDAAPGNHPSATFNSVINPLIPSGERVRNFAVSNIRPDIILEQGVFTSIIDSTFMIDSVQTDPMQLMVYTDSLSHGVPDDTIMVWAPYHNHYTFDIYGWATDSMLVTDNDTLFLSHYTYYNVFTKIDQYELGRFITPYGNGLSLGNGFTWTFDVSDYRTLLTDSVHLTAGNWQELLEMHFEMIKGTPPRNITGIQNLYKGGYNYGDNTIENYLTPKTVTIPSNAVTARWKSRVTGHGMDTPSNCAEFCPRTHYYKVNGTQQFQQLVHRYNCDKNPLQPQGGTWVYERSNWCPGAEVSTYDFELTPFITPGSNITLDHDVEPYTHTGGWDYFQIEDQLVTYGAPNFTNDAAIEDILAPSTNQMYGHFNTVCSHPIIIIKNTGSSNLTSLTINFGLNTGTQSTYNWTGNLKFMEIDTVHLSNFSWAQGADKFNVTISNPNGQADQYAPNNSKTSKYVYPVVMPSKFVIELVTNLSANENSYTLKDASGNIVASRNNLSNSTTYRDTVTLADGCYEFSLLDAGEDGLSWWANTGQGNGYLRFRKTSPMNAIIKNFVTDFGGEIYQQFTVGLNNNLEEYVFEKETKFNVYPNPSNGHIVINFDMPASRSGKIIIKDLVGDDVYEKPFSNAVAGSIEADLSNLASGVYLVTFQTDVDHITKKVMIQK